MLPVLRKAVPRISARSAGGRGAQLVTIARKLRRDQTDADNAGFDRQRPKALEPGGYLVLHFRKNEMLNNADGVVESIPGTSNKLSSVPSHPSPLPNGVREQS
jgi:very-short-patch-repair endonuclease